MALLGQTSQEKSSSSEIQEYNALKSEFVNQNCGEYWIEMYKVVVFLAQTQSIVKNDWIWVPSPNNVVDLSEFIDSFKMSIILYLHHG